MHPPVAPGREHLDASLLEQGLQPSDAAHQGDDIDSVEAVAEAQRGTWCELAAEVVYAVIYLVVALLCFWAARVHGPGFCTGGKVGVGDTSDEVRTYVGPDGLVVMWLHMEALFAVLVPLSPPILRTCCGSRRSWVVGITFALSLVQTGLFAFGCALTLGGAEGRGLVPKECWSGKWGDAVAYWVVRSISITWIGMVAFSAACTWFIGCHQLIMVRRAWLRAKQHLYMHRERLAFEEMGGHRELRRSNGQGE